MGKRTSTRHGMQSVRTHHPGSCQPDGAGRLYGPEQNRQDNADQQRKLFEEDVSRMERGGRDMRKIRIESICLIGVLICALMILGSAGAYECDTITFFEFVWQLLTFLLGGLGLCMVIWCEETKAARKAKVIHRTWWTW